MRRWYEEEGGFMEITKIPYDQLNCKSCHVKSCDQCHLKKRRAKSVFKRKKARDMNTCLSCHGREGMTFRFDVLSRIDPGIHTTMNRGGKTLCEKGYKGAPVLDNEKLVGILSQRT
jgi:hypothetical protein